MSDHRKFKMECEGCRKRVFIVTYDASVPMQIVSFDCTCGHTTQVKQPPELRIIPGDGLAANAPSK